MKIIFAGTPKVAKIVLERLAQVHEICLVITRPDAATGRKRELVPSEVAKYAQEHGIPVLKTNKLSNAEFDIIRQANADVSVVVAFGSLIPASALAILPWWNLHFSVLPKWRGASPLQHSLIHAEGQGITIFELEPGLDTGPIIVTKDLVHPNNVPAGELLNTLSFEGANMLLTSLESRVALKPQHGVPSYAPRIHRVDARLDFDLPADNLQRRVFAFNPEPMSWCKAGDGELRILSAKAVGAFGSDSRHPEDARSGDLFVDDSKVYVRCGRGTALELLLVQPSGGKVMAAVDWLRGFKGVKLD
jgi:methionyl-tRNA formyltransferase